MATLSFGTKYTFNSAKVAESASCKLDSTHFVIVYKNASDNKPYAVIGTESGGVLSYGTPLLLQATTNPYGFSVAMVDSTHFVVCFVTEQLGVLRINICSVSGTTITKGTNSDRGSSPSSACRTSVAVLDSTHFVYAVARDSATNSAPYASVGTFSGTTISGYSNGGSAINFVANNAGISPHSVIAIDSTHFVVAYEDTGDSSHGKAIIGTYSGGNITFGTAYAFETTSAVAGNGGEPNLIFVDSTTFIAVWARGSASGQSVRGTISGGVISYGTIYQFSSVQTLGIGVDYLDTTNFVISYRDNTDGHGASVIGTNTSGVLTYSSTVTFQVATIEIITSIASLTATTFVQVYGDQSNSLGIGVIGTATFAALNTNFLLMF